jgi:hypothetical protein
LYLIPAMQYSFLFLVSGVLYALKYLMEKRRQRRGNGAESSSLSILNSRHFRRVAIVAALIVLERIVYRHAYFFALGVELSVLKVRCSPRMRTM